MDLFMEMHLLQSNLVTSWSPGRDSNTIYTQWALDSPHQLARALNLYENTEEQAFILLEDI